MMGDSELVPVPNTEQPELPTPQDYGLPANPTATQLATWEAQETFLQCFSESASVGAACIASGVAVGTVDSWGSRDTHGFKKRKVLAGELFLGKVEVEINRRAIEGIDHPVIHQGVITDTYKQYSDNLLMFRTKRLDPAYRDNPPPTVDNSARQALEAMTRAVVQFNNAQIQININPGGSEEKPEASIIDMGQKPDTNPEDKPTAG